MRYYNRGSTSLSKMAGEMAKSQSSSGASSTWRYTWPSFLRWIPTSTEEVIASEKRLLSIVKTPYVQEQVNIGSGPPGSSVSWFRSASNESRFINTVTFDSEDDSPTLVMVHGYAASQGFFFRNFDALAQHFKVIAVDQLGCVKHAYTLLLTSTISGEAYARWLSVFSQHHRVSVGVDQVGLISLAKVQKISSSTFPTLIAETEAWFIDSFEEWRRAKGLSNFILLGHSFGGYVASRYALKHPEHIKHLILVGPAGFSSESEASERLTQFRATWMGTILNHLWESNFTPQKLIRGLGPWGPGLVNKYTSARFGVDTTGAGGGLKEEESKLLTEYVYHTLAAKASGELCLKYIFSFGAFARKPLVQSAPEWKVPTTFIYGVHDWMNYKGAQEARKLMKVPCEIYRVPQSGHFVFMENPTGFHSAVLYACRRILSNGNEPKPQIPEGFMPV